MIAAVILGLLAERSISDIEWRWERTYLFPAGFAVRVGRRW